MMSLADSLARAGTGALLVARQRLELAALDVEEELQRTGELLLRALATALLGAFALLALAVLVIVLCWEQGRIAALTGVAVFFAGAAVWSARALAQRLRDKPPFLHGTLAELARDGERLKRGLP